MTDDARPEPPLDAEMDEALRDAYAFAPAAAEEAAARFRLPEPSPPNEAPVLNWRVLLIPVAAVLGIAVGIQINGFRPIVVTPPSRMPGAPAPPAGFVALATKPLRGAGSATYATGRALQEGETVEAPADGRVSLILSDGTEVRLDRGARVTLGRGRNLELASGRIWSRVAKGDPFLLAAGGTRVTVLGTELSVLRERDRSEVQLFSGSARVEAGGESRDLAAGQEVEFEEGKLSDVRRIYSEAIATGWMLELFAYAGRHDRDLAEHMDRMLAEMGRRKMAHLEEEAIVEDLGPVCRVPVARFLVSESARTETEARRKAARVLVSIADASVAAELAAALRDPDADVRVLAAKAIRRVSEGAACPEPEAFRASCDDGAAAAADAWARSCAPASPPK